MAQETGNHKKLTRGQRKEKAYKFFLKGNSLRETAKYVGADISTVFKWSKKEHWKVDQVDAAESIRAGVKKKAIEEGVNYTLDICRLQQTLEEAIPHTAPGSKEGLIREIRELEKLKIFKKAAGDNGDVGFITGDDIYFAIRRAADNAKPGKNNTKASNSPTG